MVDCQVILLSFYQECQLTCITIGNVLNNFFLCARLSSNWLDRFRPKRSGWATTEMNWSYSIRNAWRISRSSVLCTPISNWCVFPTVHLSSAHFIFLWTSYHRWRRLLSNLKKSCNVVQPIWTDSGARELLRVSSSWTQRVLRFLWGRSLPRVFYFPRRPSELILLVFSFIPHSNYLFYSYSFQMFSVLDSYRRPAVWPVLRKVRRSIACPFLTLLLVHLWLSAKDVSPADCLLRPDCCSSLPESVRT